MSDKSEPEVTQQDAVKFLEGAVRNWSHVPRLSNEDIEDVRVELERFILSAVKEQ